MRDGDFVGLTMIQGDMILARQDFSSAFDQCLNQSINSAPSYRRNSLRANWNEFASRGVGPWVELDQTGMVRRFAWLTEPQQDVGTGNLRLRALDPDLFDDIAAAAQSRGIDQYKRDTAKRQWHLDDVTRSPRDGGHDRPLGLA